MKPLRFLAFLLVASCASTPAPDSPQETERKMIGFLEKFDRFDYDGDGYLTRQEILEGVRDNQLDPLEPASFERAFAFYDTNKDGRISLAEANAGLRRGPEALAN